MSVLRLVPFVLIATLALSGCAGSKKDHALPGQRISVLELDKQLLPDTDILDVPVAPAYAQGQ